MRKGTREGKISFEQVEQGVLFNRQNAEGLECQIAYPNSRFNPWLLILSLTWWARSLTSKSPASHHEDLVNAMHALENALENGLGTSTTS